jgi:hypothetical protein
VLLGDTSLGKERHKGLIGSLDEHKLEWVAVEGDALEGAQDSVKHSTASNYRHRVR